MAYDDKFEKLCEALEGAGAFLVVEDGRGRVNAMTIGWAQLGVVWGERIMTVLVRPSRHTHSLLETAAGFAVCVPHRGMMKKELVFCGSKSGRDYDKIRACALKLKVGPTDGLKYIDGCALVYHCGMYGRTELERKTVSPEAVSKYYPGDGLPHTLYFGKVLKAERFQ